MRVNSTCFREKIIMNDDIWLREETCGILLSQVSMTVEETIESDMDLMACVCHRERNEFLPA